MCVPSITNPSLDGQKRLPPIFLYFINTFKSGRMDMLWPLGLILHHPVQCLQSEYLLSVQNCIALATLAFLAATHFHLTPDLAPPVAEMGHGCHTCICNTKYSLHNFEKLDFKLVSAQCWKGAAYKLLFVCFLSGCPLQHAEQDMAWKLTSTCEMVLPESPQRDLLQIRAF